MRTILAFAITLACAASGAAPALAQKPAEPKI